MSGGMNRYLGDYWAGHCHWYISLALRFVLPSLLPLFTSSVVLACASSMTAWIIVVIWLILSDLLYGVMTDGTWAP